MKKIVVFYSLDGNTRLIAENIAQAINAETLELIPKNKPKAKGFMKYIWAGKELVMKSKPDLQPLGKNIQDYDVLFIGTPVWVFNYAPPLNMFFSTTPIRNKKIALFCCHGGMKGKVFDKMKKRLENNEIIGTIDFLEPAKREKEKSITKARQWAQDILQ